MLFYKAWRESQMRFLISALVLAVICASVIFFQKMFRAEMHALREPLNTYAGYIYLRIYAGFARGIFLILVLVLGLGGLQRERAHGSACFTLALPVSRFRLMGIRALLGILEVAILALIPVILVPGLSAIVEESYPLMQSIQFSVLWICIGSAVFASSFLFSAIFTSEYTAMAVSFVVFLIYPLTTRIPALRPYPLQIHYIMNGNGMAYFDPRTDLLIGPLPWVILSVALTIALGMIASATLITLRQDFS